MSRFVNNRRFVLIYCAVALAAGNLVFTSSQPTYAEGWADLLKPLVKDVIVPGASMGMKKLMERNNKKHGQTTESSAASESSSGTDNSWADSAFSTPEEPVTSSGSSDEMMMSTPEEPMSTGSADEMLSTPEETISVSSQVTSPMDPPPPPPPPVETPSYQ